MRVKENSIGYIEAFKTGKIPLHWLQLKRFSFFQINLDFEIYIEKYG